MLLRGAVESLLIVFSVLLALFLDSTRTRYAERAATREQLESIHSELQTNRGLLDELTERHASISRNVRALRTDPPDQPLIVDGRLRLEVVLGQSLAERMVRNTAWETAKATGLIRNFDLDCANLLTDVYSLQEIVQGTILEVAALLGERETHREAHLGETLVLLSIWMDELLGQELYLGQGYEQVLSAFQSGSCG